MNLQNMLESYINLQNLKLSKSVEDGIKYVKILKSCKVGFTDKKYLRLIRNQLRKIESKPSLQTTNRHNILSMR